MNKCPSNKILNPKTNRCVLKTGVIGKRILNSNIPEFIPRFQPERYSVEEIVYRLEEQIGFYNQKKLKYKKFIVIGDKKSVEFEEFKFKDIGEILRDNYLYTLEIIKNTSKECIIKMNNLIFQITYTINEKKVEYLVTLLSK